MRGAVPVLFTAHLIKHAVTRQVSALNPALRIPPTVRQKLLKQYTDRMIKQYFVTLQEIILK
jgi:hypothetical protein